MPCASKNQHAFGAIPCGYALMSSLFLVVAFAPISWPLEVVRACLLPVGAQADRWAQCPYVQLQIGASRVLCFSRTSRSHSMEWVTPQHEEIDLNCEVSSYANAEL